MPFEYVLADLLAKVPNALGAIFLDDSGETIDLASAENSPEELRVFGAYFEIALRQLRSNFAADGLGEVRILHVRHRGAEVYAACLPDDYFLVLLQARPGLSALARKHLAEAAVNLRRELFPR